MELSIEVFAFFSDQLISKDFSFNDGTLSFIAGVPHKEDKFKFSQAKKLGLFSKKPKSVTKKNYLNDIILSSEDSGYFTPVK